MWEIVGAFGIISMIQNIINLILTLLGNLFGL